MTFFKAACLCETLWSIWSLLIHQLSFSGPMSSNAHTHTYLHNTHHISLHKPLRYPSCIFTVTILATLLLVTFTKSILQAWSHCRIQSQVNLELPVGGPEQRPPPSRPDLPSCFFVTRPGPCWQQLPVRKCWKGIKDGMGDISALTSFNWWMQQENVGDMCLSVAMRSGWYLKRRPGCLGFVCKSGQKDVQCVVTTSTRYAVRVEAETSRQRSAA